VPGQGEPLRVTVPAIGVDAPLTPVALLPDGAMETPEFGHAGWYSPGPKPGEPGPSVVVAHVDSKANGPDVFFRLRELAPGDHVTVHYENTATTFVVTGGEQAAKTALPTDRIWNGATAPVLRLITCGGPFDRAAGSYLDNVIVYADRLV
jgi:sortase (surface protein transpeptidase)